MIAPDSTVAVNAERASEEALATLFTALDNRRNFKLEAGAGAGKTYSLIQALRRILDNKSVHLPRSDQRVACLTYTKVARDEIKARTDEDPAIFADTLHGFLWEMISPYQKALKAAIRLGELAGESRGESRYQRARDRVRPRYSWPSRGPNITPSQ